MKNAFEAAHRSRFGFIDETKSLAFDALFAEAVGGGGTVNEPEQLLSDARPAPTETTRFYSQGEWHNAPVFLRADMRPGMSVSGPAILVEPNQTIVVEADWRLEISARDHVVLRRVETLRFAPAVGTVADPVLLEVFNNLLMSIAEQMGVTLQNTALWRDNLGENFAAFGRAILAVAAG